MNNVKHTGRATEIDVPSKALISANTARVKKIRRARLVNLNSPMPELTSAFSDFAETWSEDIFGSYSFSAARVATDDVGSGLTKVMVVDILEIAELRKSKYVTIK